MHIKKRQTKRIENQIRRLRIELLAKPKLRRLKPWPDPAVYRKLPWKVPRAAMTAIPSEQILRLYAPKKDFTHKPPSMCIESGHYVSQYAMKAVATPRIVRLARPKRLHEPPPPPPKTKRQLKRERELRENLEEAMARLARPPRMEIVKKPEDGEQPEESQVPVEPQPPPSPVKKPPVASPAAPGGGRAGGKPNWPQSVPASAQPAPAASPAPPANPKGKRPSGQINKTTAPIPATPASAPIVDAKATRQKAQQPAIVAGAKKK